MDASTLSLGRSHDRVALQGQIASIALDRDLPGAMAVGVRFDITVTNAA